MKDKGRSKNFQNSKGFALLNSKPCGIIGIQRDKHLSGFTLIEFIVVITIVGILIVGLSTYIIKGIDLWQLITFRNEITASGRLALFRMGREIKQIKNDLSVHIASASRFKFDDVNSSSIDYQLSSSNLKRNSDILARGTSSLAFIYYDVNNAEIATPLVSPNATNIHRIKIVLEVASGDQTKTLTSQIHPRNF
ncbi:MAG: type II secretion system GspH family protein [Candidatus Omnitrophica bacterium]|nr:type II secretion system GspH family protein [Candidatus Omnitrophota bacterium]MBU1778122.1 type II secretion system GspH family protein [Patescibacteria group bacterium]